MLYTFYEHKNLHIYVSTLPTYYGVKLICIFLNVNFIQGPLFKEMKYKCSAAVETLRLLN